MISLIVDVRKLKKMKSLIPLLVTLLFISSCCCGVLHTSTHTAVQYNSLNERSNISQYFQNCTGYIDYVNSLANVLGPSEKFISPIECQHVYLFKEYVYPPMFNFVTYSSLDDVKTYFYSNTIFDTIGRFDVCERISGWENRLNLTSNQLMYQYYMNVTMFDVYNATNGETTLYDWINYWTYCESSHSSQFNISRTGNLPDYLRAKSVLYCGSMEFGIPIIQSNGNYMCHCTKYDYFAPKCNGNYKNYRSTLIIWYTSITIVSIGLLTTIFVVLLPKLITAFNSKHFITLNTIIFNMATMIGIISNLVVITTNGSPDIFKFLSAIESVMIILCTSSLLFWILKHLRMVLFIKNRQYPSNIKWIYVSVYAFCFTLAGIFVPLIVFLKKYQSVYYFILEGVMVAVFLTSSLIVYIIMRRTTDVDIIKSTVSILHFKMNLTLNSLQNMFCLLLDISPCCLVFGLVWMLLTPILFVLFT